MLQECANPTCHAQFKYLHQGKLFEVEFQYRDSSVGEPRRNLKNGKGHVELYWLCERCAAHVMLRFDRGQGLIMVDSFSDCNKVVLPMFPQPSGRNPLEIARILIRPLDLHSTVTGNANRRTREAA